MRISKFVLLFALILAFVSDLVRARNVKLYNQRNKRVEIGNVLADKTTVGQLKQIIAGELGISLESLRLIGGNLDPMNEDEKLVCEYLDINDEAIVEMVDDLTISGEIQVVLRGVTSFILVVDKQKTLGWIKEQVLKESQRDLYRVIYEGKELTDDLKTLADFKLYLGACIVMFKGNDTFRVLVFPSEGDKIDLQVTIDTKVRDLKKTIDSKGINMDSRYLIYRNRRLEDERKLFSYSKLFHYGIMDVYIVERLGESGSTLEMIYIKNDFLQHFPIFVTSNNTVGELKKYAYKIDPSIPIEQMELTFGKLIMGDDSRKLADYELYPNAEIYVNRIVVTSQSKINGLETENFHTPDESEATENPQASGSDTNNPNANSQTEAASQNSEEECWICYESLNNDEEPNVLTDCNHKFHRKCLLDWKKKSDYGKECPICRHKLADSCFE